MTEDEILEDLDDVSLETDISCADYVTDALMLLDGRCDGAITDDGVGFAAMHTYTGKKIAAKIANGYHYRWFELEWMGDSLPYYFNTQLAHIDADVFKECINDLLGEAHKREYTYKLEKGKLEMRLEDDPDEVAKELLDMDYDTVSTLPPAAKSLQNFYSTKKYWTEKQRNYAASLVTEYKIKQLRKKIFYRH